MPQTLVEPGAVTFEAFFDHANHTLVRAMFLVTGSRPEAEELAQDAMVRAYERWDRIGGMRNPAGYVYRIALNLHRSRLRRLRVAARSVAARSEPDPLDAADDRDALRRALQRLPRGQREALVLVAWLGMTDAEAGNALRCSPGAVRVRLTRARQALRPLLRGDDDG